MMPMPMAKTGKIIFHVICTNWLTIGVTLSGIDLLQNILSEFSNLPRENNARGLLPVNS